MAKNWLKKAIDPAKKGALHKALGVPLKDKIPAKKLEEASQKEGRIGRMARLAKTMRGFKH